MKKQISANLLIYYSVAEKEKKKKKSYHLNPH